MAKVSAMKCDDPACDEMAVRKRKGHGSKTTFTEPKGWMMIQVFGTQKHIHLCPTCSKKHFGEFGVLPPGFFDHTNI